MKRDIYNKLVGWKNSDRRKPLILRGARQTGKTYILEKFGKNEYTNYIYINFERKSKLTDILKGDLTTEEIIENISVFTGKKVMPEKTLIFFDEIQLAPRVLRSLKYFNEDCNEYHIVSAGSLLGLILSRDKEISFPVGKINFLDMYPLSFKEFVLALGEERFLSVIPDNFDEIKPLKSIFHDKLIDLLKLYFFVGGMPDVVADYIKHKNFKRVRVIQKEIINTNLNDFSKHATKSETMKIRQIWNSIPLHLGNENKVFIFSAIKNSARGKDYEIAMQWLLDAGLIIQVKNISRPLLPLMAYTDLHFKIYVLDVGLLGAMTNLNQKSLVVKTELFSHFKGALVENFVIREISRSTVPYYWSNKGKAEIDLVMEHEDRIYPIEIKSSINLKAKSLGIYNETFSPKLLLRSSTANFNKGDNIIDIPLYALNSIVTDEEMEFV